MISQACVATPSSPVSESVPTGARSYGGFAESDLVAFLTTRCGEGVQALQLEAQDLRGGLEAVTVATVRASFVDGGGRRRTTRFVAKRLGGVEAREDTVYRTLVAAATNVGVGAPRLLGSVREGPDATSLYLEHVTPWRHWPWPDLSYARLVLEQLAILHSVPTGAAFEQCSNAWDYDAVLNDSAHKTLAMLDIVAEHGDDPAGAAEARPALRRMVAVLPRVRQTLLAAAPFGVTAIHGDVHPGNVIIRAQGATRGPIFLDWSRARLGSPLEDVSSWLHWLGYWVPAARQHHDGLLRHCLAARGLSRHLSREIRTAVWLAETCNVLSGALRYHCAVLEGWGAPTPTAQEQSAPAARDCLRVIRRADALWRAS